MPEMDSDNNDTTHFGIECDLHFLIARFLLQGPCRESGRTLVRELERNGLLHESLDWTGNVQRPAFDLSLSRFRDLAPDHLLQICSRIAHLVGSESSACAQSSLCGLGRFSLTQSKKQCSDLKWNSRTYSACIARRPLVPAHVSTPTYNWAFGIFGRENGGSRFKNLLRPIRTLYGQMKLHRRILGHLSSVYCILYDRTGTRIFTGSDDCLIKCWSSSQGRLLATFRGHQSEICDMDICYENSLLASASCDKEIRIWDTRNGKPITILQSHSAMITSVEFSAMVQGNTRYLVSTGRDGNVIFWTWDVQKLEFDSHPHKFEERNRPGVAMLCSSCSAGGRFVAVGGSDNLVHIYNVPLNNNNDTIWPLTIAEQSEHSNTVDSIWFSNDGFRLISGSKDGTARVWTYEYSTWNSLILDVARTKEFAMDLSKSACDANEPCSSKPSASKSQGKDNANKIRVIMVAWDCCDENVFTSLTDYTVKVWNSNTRRLVSILKGHTDEAYCLEPHPNDKRILLTAGHDGNVFLWDVTTGHTLMSFHNMLEGLGHGAVFDAKFSRDGNSFTCTDSHGHLLIFGYGDGKPYHKCPVHQFFHTDYRPLIRDQQGYVLDEQTQQAPHLMPPPFLVDMDGNPYPPDLQRLVPGRERSNESQLLPNLVVSVNDSVEVFDVENIPEAPPVPHTPGPHSALDDRIQELLHGGNEEGAPGSAGEPPPFASPSSTVGLRREGDTAGVRQMHPNAPRSQVASMADIMALTQRVITPQFSREELERLIHSHEEKGQSEFAYFKREQHKKRRPVSHRRSSRDGANQTLKEQVTQRSLRRARSSIRFKEDPEDVEEENEGQSIRRRIRRMRAFAHGYSTRSTAPRSGMPSVAESNHEDILEVVGLDEEEERFTSASGETSVVSSSEEDFSQKAKILRRSKRSKGTNGHIRHRKEDDRAHSSDDDKENLRRSKRQRRLPKRLENSSDDDSSAPHSEDNGSVESSRFLSPHVDHSRRLPSQKKRRKKRAQRLSSVASNVVDSTDEEQKTELNDDQPTTSASCQEKIKVQLNGETTSKTDKSVVTPKSNRNNVIQIPFAIVPGQLPPDLYLPTEWVKRVTPCNFPYMPQIEDEIVYLRQGHEFYISKVLSEHVWTVDDGELCYKIFPEIGVAEPCRVTSIEYLVGPPTLCKVLLMPLNQKVSKKSTGFTVKYHDMPNVVDFLILKDKYDISINRKWSPGDRFRSIIDDSWWYGTIVEHNPQNPVFPDSHFQSYSIVWDCETDQSDVDYLSPWDMEPVSNAIITRSHHVLSSTTVVHARIDPKEMRKIISYNVRRTDWMTFSDIDSDDEEGDEEAWMERKLSEECKRILDGLQKIIDTPKYAAFVSPVDLTVYPTYPLWVAYPTDLSSIAQKVRNRFYRRSEAICWEISQLKKNALAFNEPDSVIAKTAQFLCTLLQKFVKDRSWQKIRCRQLTIAAKDANIVSDLTGSSSDGALSERSHTKGISSSDSMEETGKSEHELQDISEYATTAGEEEDLNTSWVSECRALLENVMLTQDSRPFRSLNIKDDDYEEADHEEDGCLDLPRIERRLLNSIYKDPEQLKSDVLLMFSEFKNSNPSREDRTMMMRLSPLMSLHINDIIVKYEKSKLTKLSSQTRKGSLRRGRSSASTDMQSSNYRAQGSDWVIQPRRSNRPHKPTSSSKICAYPTRRMLRRHSKTLPASVPPSSRSHRSCQLKMIKIKEESEEERELSDTGGSQNGVKTEPALAKGIKSASAKRRYLDSENEIGQGDACLSLRLRKKPRILTETGNSSDENDPKVEESDVVEESESDFGEASRTSRRKKNTKNNKHVKNCTKKSSKKRHDMREARSRQRRFTDHSSDEECQYSISRSDRNGQLRRSSRSDKRIERYVYDDSDSDTYDGMIETDDLEGEFPPLSPEGHLLPKKNTRFRNSFPTN